MFGKSINIDPGWAKVLGASMCVRYPCMVDMCVVGRWVLQCSIINVNRWNTIEFVLISRIRLTE